MSENPETKTLSPEWQTLSGITLKPYYRPSGLTAEQIADTNTAPGQPPFVRGAYPDMYRSKIWRIFQLSGFGNPEDENERVKFLLAHGETGFILEHDRMTADHLYDVDHPQVTARREDVGLNGSVTLSMSDFEILVDGIEIEKTYAHAGAGVVQWGPFCHACYWSIAQKRGIPLKQLPGTGQSDFFLTYLGCICKEQIPPQAGMRLNCDQIEFCTAELPRWVPISIPGYNASETGLNAWEELGAVFANAIEHVDTVVARGRLQPEAFVGGVGGINLAATMDIFETAAKFRAARRMWYKLLTKRYGVTDEKALRLRIHALTAGSAMTYQQPLNNIARGTIMALGAVMGGAQSIGVSGYDEAISIPSEHAQMTSLRIQQILQNECSLAGVADPLGGSAYVEELASELEERAIGFMEEIETAGGFVNTLDTGWLHERAHKHQLEREEAINSGTSKVVGVNCYAESEAFVEIAGFEGSHDAYDRALARLNKLRDTRNSSAVKSALSELGDTCLSDRNIIPPMMAAVQAGASLGEVGEVFRAKFGVWKSPIAF